MMYTVNVIQSEVRNMSKTTQLSQEQTERVVKLQRPTQSFEDCFNQIVMLGLYQLEYRRNERAPKDKVRRQQQADDAKRYRRLVEAGTITE